MSIEEQIRTIAKEELETQLSEMEKRFQEIIDKEIGEVKDQLEEISENLGGLSSRIESGSGGLWTRRSRRSRARSSR
jgi:DNA anti-recombination protein RmuC